MTSLQPVNRIHSIDILRGIVMVVMALDHTRDFFHNQALLSDPLDPATTNVALFFTRWITHFCAPVFVLLSGVSAYLAAQNKPIKAASRFLIQRGLFLIVIEITVVTFGLTFNPFFNFIFLQIIWAIGWSMVILGLLMRGSFKIILATGLVLLIGHNFLQYLPLPKEGVWHTILQITLTSRAAVLPLSATHFVGVFYAILPWTAVMLLGYCMGSWFTADIAAATRKKRLLVTGSILVLLFITLRLINNFGDQQPMKDYGTAIQNLFSFLNTSKYPPSLQFVCMTIGPALILLSFMEKKATAVCKLFMVYGRVPLFYFIIHFYLLHLLTVIGFFVAGYDLSQIADPQSPFLFRPPNFGYSLPVVYAIWLLVLASLYYPCKRFYAYKQLNKKGWLRYV